MTRTPVVSSNVAEIGYDEHTQTLEIAYRPSRAGVMAVWTYFPVTLDAYETMMAPGESVGRHVNAVKQNPSITATKLADAPPEAS